jgi:enoyl-CoA hydratase
MSYQTIQFEKRGPIGVITLDRPEKRNAISNALIDECHAALDAARDDDEVRVVVLTGAGKSFCAGFDLTQGTPGEKRTVGDWRALLTRDFQFIMRFWEFEKPTIAAVHGHAVAGGCELALACDITIADEEAVFGEPELRFGSGIVAMLMPWLTGPKQAKELLLTGNDRISAGRALALGLINQVTPPGGALEAACAMARDIAVMEPEKVALVKKAVNQSLDIMGMRTAMAAALDIDVQIEALETPDGVKFREVLHAEGMKAALAWRESRFAGED